MNSISSNLRKYVSQGYSLVESLLVIGVLSLVAATGYLLVSGVTTSASSLKLQKDVATINSALKIYQASGGSIEPNNEEGAILSLKREASAANAPTIAGLRGKMIDTRLVGVLASSGDGQRAVWNGVTKQFELKPSGVGYAKFALSDSAPMPTVLTDDRASSLALSPDSHWVWNYRNGPAPETPSPVRRSNPGSSIDPNTSGDASPPLLSQPTIEIPSGTFTWSQITAGLGTRLTDTNPEGAATLYYAIGGGAWTEYQTGAIIPLLQGQSVTNLRAYAAANDIEQYGDSSSANESYNAKPRTKLSKPAISRLGGLIRWTESRGNLSVSLSDGNSPGTRKLMYRLGTSGSWIEYRGGSIPIVRAPDLRTTVMAYAKSTLVDDFEDSDTVSETYEVQMPQQLAAPLFSKVPGYYKWDGIRDSAMVTLANPNPPGSSAMMVSVNGAAFTPYTGSPIPLFTNGFKTSIRTYAKPINLDLYATSVGKEGKYSTVWFSGGAASTFTNPKGDSGMVSNLNTSGSSNPTFKWGRPLSSSFQNELNIGSGSFNKISPETQFKIGTLTYKNGTTYAGSNATEIYLATTLNFSEPSISELLSFKFTLNSTPNNTGTADGDADYVKIGTLASTFRQKIEGKTFYLKLQFGAHGADGFTTINTFHTHEEKSMTGDLYGVLTTTAPDGTSDIDPVDAGGDFVVAE